MRYVMDGSSFTILSETPCADPHRALWGLEARNLRLPDWAMSLL